MITKRPFRIAIASGKGGTGKTTVSVNLYQRISKDHNRNVLLVDCDVEEPNTALFFPGAGIKTESPVLQEIPRIDLDQCTFCRKCSDYCEFNAILVIPSLGFSEVNPKLCHSCGACLVACEQNAISTRNEPIGALKHYDAETGMGIMEGSLKIGSPMQTMVIRFLKQSLPPDMDLILYDAPPGTSCSVVETISGSDYLVLVSEPTPFGVNDLKLMISLAEKMEIPFGVVINKANLGNGDLKIYLKENNIRILCEIPFDLNYASKYAVGELFKNIPTQIEAAHQKLCDTLMEIAHTT